MNAVVGVSQESSAEKAIAALNEYSANEATVIRNGHAEKIKAEDLVPGDIIDVAVGDRIPADCRVLSIHSNSFRVDQAILTGESESVGKDTRPVMDEDAVKQDMINMLFSGTTVTIGKARAVVVYTGESTAIGDIHTSIVSQISEPTPLKQKLNDFGDVLAKVISVICILVWVINVRNFSDEAHGGWVKGAMYYLKVRSARMSCLPSIANNLLDLGVSRCCGYPRRSGRRHHHLLGFGYTQDGSAKCSCEKLAFGRDSRKLQRYLL